MGKESRTCNETGEERLMLFGVNILEKNPIRVGDTLKKSFSMVNLGCCCHGENKNDHNQENSEAGYLSDVLIQNKKQR
ncbi:putative transcription factor [Sesbania bispinosa]|nr:putative transcription factor [Sesbania bispinosa]